MIKGMRRRPRQGFGSSRVRQRVVVSEMFYCRIFSSLRTGHHMSSLYNHNFTYYSHPRYYHANSSLQTCGGSYCAAIHSESCA